MLCLFFDLTRKQTFTIQEAHAFWHSNIDFGNSIQPMDMKLKVYGKYLAIPIRGASPHQLKANLGREKFWIENNRI
jgi:hypothetical protein